MTIFSSTFSNPLVHIDNKCTDSLSNICILFRALAVSEISRRKKMKRRKHSRSSEGTSFAFSVLVETLLKMSPVSFAKLEISTLSPSSLAVKIRLRFPQNSCTSVNPSLSLRSLPFLKSKSSLKARSPSSVAPSFPIRFKLQDGSFRIRA